MNEKNLRILSIGAAVAIRRTGGLVLLATLSACANGRPLPVSLTYTPDSIVHEVPGAEFVYVEVTVNDRRQEKNKVGEFSAVVITQPIVTRDDPAEVIKSGVDSELRNRGFELGKGNASVMIDLDGIEARRSASQARAMTIMSVAVERNTGAMLYQKQVSGKASFATKDNETLSSGSQRVLDDALDDAVRNLVADPTFIKALLETNKTANTKAPIAHAAPTPSAIP